MLIFHRLHCYRQNLIKQSLAAKSPLLPVAYSYLPFLTLSREDAEERVMECEGEVCSKRNQRAFARLMEQGQGQPQYLRALCLQPLPAFIFSLPSSVLCSPPNRNATVSFCIQWTLAQCDPAILLLFGAMHTQSMHILSWLQIAYKVSFLGSSLLS